MDVNYGHNGEVKSLKQCCTSVDGEIKHIVEIYAGIAGEVKKVWQYSTDMDVEMEGFFFIAGGLCYTEDIVITDGTTIGKEG